MVACLLSDSQARWLRLRAQGLTGEPATDAVAVVRALVAIQAQFTPSAGLAVRARGTGLRAAALDEARNRLRSVVRTWAMRSTLHVVASEDLAWVLSLLGPLVVAAGRRRRGELGLDDDLCRRGTAALRDILADAGPLTRDQLVDRLAARGIPLQGQARPYLLTWAAARGVVCHGPDDERGEALWVLVEDWLGPLAPVELDAALAELTRRYLGAHGPADPHDLAAWAGVPVPLARRGFELVDGELREVRLDGRPLWMLAGEQVEEPPAGGPHLRLLGQFDPYLLGWRTRDLVLDRGFATRVNSGGGLLRPALLVDGHVVATWQQRRTGRRLTIEVEPFQPLAPAILPALEREVADVGRFLGLDAALAGPG